MAPKNNNAVPEETKPQTAKKHYIPRSVPNTADKPLTPKQQAFVDYLIANPTASKTEAAKHAYNIGGKHGLRYDPSGTMAASAIANENLHKPSIIAALEKHAITAKNTMLEVMDYSKKLGKRGLKGDAAYAAVAVTASKDVLDRVLGKPKQQIEMHTTAVSISLDLTATLTDVNETA